MDRFRLLQLPSLALQAVLEFHDPFELFDLSQCSKNSTAIVRLAGTKHYKLSLESERVVVNEKYRFETCRYSNLLQEKRSFSLTNGNKIFVHVGCYRRCRDRFLFIDSDSGLQVILFHLIEIFGCRIDSIDTRPTFPGKIQRSIMELVIKKQKEIKSLTIRENLTQKDMTWILDNLTIIDYCKCAVETSPDFGYGFKTYPRMLCIDYSHWFKLEDLYAAAKSCISIQLFDSKLRNKDIDVFMKLWVSGIFPTLRLLEVRNEDFNQWDQILGRNPRQFWNNNRAVVREKIIIDGQFLGHDNGVKFRRADGIEVKIEMNWGQHESYFRLYVL